MRLGADTVSSLTIPPGELIGRLEHVCQAGGLNDVAALAFHTPAHGRIHDVYLVHDSSHPFVLQRVNTNVIADPVAPARVSECALQAQGIENGLLNWPATGTALLFCLDSCWLRRGWIYGKPPEQPVTVKQVQGMSRALRHFHQTIDLAAFKNCRYASIDPWSGIAGLLLQESISNPQLQLDSYEREAIAQLGRARQTLALLQDSTVANCPAKLPVVVHRDPKPSNFIERSRGDMVLIDFDTIGIGAAEQDLGEMLRALLTGDESSESKVTTADDCKGLIHQIQQGYGDSAMTQRRISLAACHSCLWQAERYLEDHLAGDRYYKVISRGDNLLRTRAQLEGFDLVYVASSGTGPQIEQL
ncbi:MAG: aminoglycoside phosphotransferase family protein [Granulosicoccus sp.]|nr:aminoglycoside phosphotransferase family protein [Granulosicoccus sp.]